MSTRSHRTHSCVDEGGVVNMKRATVFKNGRTDGGRVIAISGSLEDMLSEASRKLDFQVEQLYTPVGGLIDDVRLIRDEDLLYASGGEPFIRLRGNIKTESIPKELHPQIAHHELCAQSEWVKLNVGGRLFTTTISTLTRTDSNSMLARMFTHGDVEWQSSVDETGAYLIDRSPQYFEPILNYLRHGQLVMDKSVNAKGVLEEARFFGLTSLMAELEEVIEREQPPDDTTPITRRELVMALMVTPTNKELRCQTPDDFLSKESFDAIQNFIITKPELQSRLVTVTAFGKKFVGCPVCIEDKKYKRNALIFNLCFVFSEDFNTLSYGPVVKKLATYLIQLEADSNFISNEEKEPHILPFLQRVRQDLNQNGMCNINMGESCTVHLKVTPQEGQQGSVQDYDVPVLMMSTHEAMFQHPWDLTTQQIMHHVDGSSHVAKIAAEADVDINLVKACLQNLLYFGVAKMVSVFQYSNVYTCTPDISKLVEDRELQQECIRYVARNGGWKGRSQAICSTAKDADHALPSFRDVFMLYCGLTPGTTVKDICVRFNPHSLKIDERRLIQFGVMKGVIRRMHKYPVKLPNASVSPQIQPIFKWLNGCHSYDEISCKTGLSSHELDELIETDPSCVICWK